MVFQPETQSYPNLVMTLREKVRADGVTLSGWVTGASLPLLIGLIAVPFAMEVNAFVGFALLIGVLVAAWRMVVSVRTAWADLSQQIQEVQVYRRMLGCLEKNRLEHDVSRPNAIVLEACAANYRRAGEALKEPHAGGGDDLRKRLRVGIDEAMKDAILSHRDALPDNPSNLPVGQTFGKMATKILFGSAEASGNPIEPAFTRTRNLAEQLRDAAEEIERSTRELGNEWTPPIPTNNLDRALDDLKMTREAEEELRENLPGG